MRKTVSSLSVISIVSLVGLVGADAVAAVGGPDPFGYSFVDQVDGAAFVYIDITATGDLLVNADDSLSMPVALGAPFTFYGETVMALTASTNGFLTNGGNSPNTGNLCPLSGPAGGGGSRIAVLHDDLVTAVYYEYLDEGAAELAGYPGETAGISVFQWEGDYFNEDGSAVDVEAILFHDDNSILTMAAVASQSGLSSTMGIQNAAGSSTLTYVCNNPGSTVGGVTAVLYSPPPVITINEIRNDQTGADDDEYVELVGPPGASLDGLSYVVLGDGGANTTGVVEAVVNLTGSVIPASGYFVMADATFTLGVADLTTVLNFENSDTTTHLLLRTFSGANGNALDADANGVLDTTPWVTVDDALAVVDAGSVELPYGPGAACQAGTSCNQFVVPADFDHMFRCGDGDGAWNDGALDAAAVPPTDSPGGPNPCACGDAILVIGEICDDGGESAMCDVDCTAPLCGDGVPNMAAGEACDAGGESAMCDTDCTAAVCGDDVVNTIAGETCDDGGRSGTCDADCTAATCGDGFVNMTAGEDCDGDGAGAPGETADCDDDCTNAMCGDMVANVSAGEECDDGDDTADCDADCTAVACGDGTINAVAGEECDDGNTDDDDGCSATCVDEAGPGTSSEGGSESSGGGDTTGATDSDASTGADETTSTPDTDDTNADTSGADMSGSASATDSDSDTDNDEDSDSDGESTSAGSGGASGDDSGCSCTTTDERDVTSPLLALFGLGALRRRRRS